ncbi:MAG: ribbon-helix-helix domain-containing protein [Hadesarchaea archaeon]|nr:ribbon-helix-helix domain-containing protein [Hadesarchaea archaeon]
MKRATIPVSLPVEVIKKLDDARAKLGYRSRNEVIRESIGRFIEEVEGMKIIKLRDIPRQKAKREIWDYLQKKEVTYASDIAEELRLDYGLVVDIIRELWEEEKVEEAK